MEDKIKIVIVDDHQLVRGGYKSIIDDYPKYIVIGEAGNGKELLDFLKENKPDVILLDIEMPVMDGFKAFEEIRKFHPQIKVIIVSMHFEDAFISHFFMNGANGYLPKSCEARQLSEAIDAVVKENYYLNSTISKVFLLDMLMQKKSKSVFDEIKMSYTQSEILKMICDEKSYKEIAAKLNLSLHAVDYHRREILSKTKQSSVIGLVKYAIKNGIAKVD
jgi:DNA-binding NarL/FixJ family response regulator